MTLSRVSKKRTVELAYRFASAGYRFFKCTANGRSEDDGLTRYVLEFDRDGYEDWTRIAGRGDTKYQTHNLYLDGVDNLDGVTGNVTLLSWMCALIRRKAYEKTIMTVHHGSGWTTTAGDRVDRAIGDYGKWSAWLFCLKHGNPFMSYTPEETQKQFDRTERELRNAITTLQERTALLDGIAPLSSPEPNWNERYKIERIQSFRYQ